MTNEELVREIRQGNKVLMADLYTQNKGFIYAIIRHLQIKPDSYDDAAQDAYLGLYEAVNRFDDNEGYKFLTYAKYYIRLAILRGQSNSLYVPEYVFTAARKIKRARDKLTQELKRTPTGAELAYFTRLDLDTIKKTLAAVKPVKSVYTPLADDLIIGDTIQDTTIDFENDIAAADEKDYISRTIRTIIDELPPREGEAIRLYYLQGMTYKQIGELQGVSSEYIRQLIKKGMRYMRKPSNAQRLLDTDIDSRTNFYNHVGLRHFNNTWTSSIEYAVLDREQMRRNIEVFNQSTVNGFIGDVRN